MVSTKVYYFLTSETKSQQRSEEKRYKNRNINLRLQILLNSEHLVRTYPGTTLLKNVVKSLETQLFQSTEPRQRILKVYRVYGRPIPLDVPLSKLLVQDEIVIFESKV
jgi:hypothetical protein